MESNHLDPKSNAKVLNLAHFRKKKKEEETLSRGRKPLYISHTERKITSKPGNNGNEDFSDRVSRIKASLERINTLMSELKKMSLMSEKDHKNNKL
ncbi:MAG: hypothetical protein R3B45_01685 [Bdellovibrionota bacterium]